MKSIPKSILFLAFILSTLSYASNQHHNRQLLVITCYDIGPPNAYRSDKLYPKLYSGELTNEMLDTYSNWRKSELNSDLVNLCNLMLPDIRKPYGLTLDEVKAGISVDVKMSKARQKANNLRVAKEKTKKIATLKTKENKESTPERNIELSDVKQECYNKGYYSDDLVQYLKYTLLSSRHIVSMENAYIAGNLQQACSHATGSNPNVKNTADAEIELNIRKEAAISKAKKEAEIELNIRKEAAISKAKKEAEIQAKKEADILKANNLRLEKEKAKKVTALNANKNKESIPERNIELSDVRQECYNKGYYSDNLLHSLKYTLLSNRHIVSMENAYIAGNLQQACSHATGSNPNVKNTADAEIELNIRKEAAISKAKKEAEIQAKKEADILKANNLRLATEKAKEDEARRVLLKKKKLEEEIASFLDTYNQLKADADTKQNKLSNYLDKERIAFRTFLPSEVIREGVYDGQIDYERSLLITDEKLSRGYYDAWMYKSKIPQKVKLIDGFYTDVFVYTEINENDSKVINFKEMKADTNNAKSEANKYYSINIEPLERQIKKL